MSGIGDTLRAERRRQGRTLADAAAETRVRESYLAAIEDEDFDVLGGDVYARGFIRLYGKYLGLDAEHLVGVFRREHERPEEITAIPGATFDDVLPGGGPRMVPTQPVLAAAGIVLALVVLFLLFRGGDEQPDVVDPNAPGPSPAAAQLPDAPTDPTAVDPALTPSTAPTGADGGSLSGAGDGTVLSEVVVVVTAIQPVQLTVERGQPPVTGATLEAGEARTLTDPAGEQVVFTVSDFSAAEITVNGGPLLNPAFAGRAVQITCTVGETGCNALPL